MREATVAASWPRAFLDFAVARGADRETLMQRACIQPHDLTDPTGRIPLVRYVALMEAGIELCSEPALALRFGEQVPMEDLSIVPLIVLNGEGVDDVRARINRYAALMVDDGEDGSSESHQFVHRGGKVWIKLVSSIYARHPVVTEAAVARSVGGVRNLLKSFGGHAATLRFPDAIHFTYSEPAHRKEYDLLFGVPLVFDSDMNAIGVNPVFLSMTMPKPYAAAAAMATEKAEQLLARLENSTPTRASVQNTLLRKLESGDVRMEAIARQLGLSRATLFRRLKAEGATFEGVLETVRHERALQLLNEEKCSVRQTAHQLGFSDPAAFSRAFKRWTGVSPKEAGRN